MPIFPFKGNNLFCCKLDLLRVRSSLHIKSASFLFSFDFSLGDSLENVRSKNIVDFKLSFVLRSFRSDSKTL